MILTKFLAMERESEKREMPAIPGTPLSLIDPTYVYYQDITV